jgi:hypothetical protein
MNKSALIDLLHGLIAIDTTSGRTEAQRQLQAHVAARLIEQDSRLGALTSSSTTGFPWALAYTKGDCKKNGGNGVA